MNKALKAAVVAGCGLTLGLVAGQPGSTSAAGAPGSEGTPEVVNVIEASGLPERDYTYGAAPVDVDRDGDQDILISNHHVERAKLWQNNGRGRFSRIARAAWPNRNSEGGVIDRHTCTWADVDRNGRPDAFCATGRTERNFVKFNRDNELWLQRRDGSFREVGTAWRIGDVCGRGRRGVFLNANGDRYPDLFVGNVVPRPVADDCNRFADRLPNEDSKLYINQSGERFRYAPARLRVTAGVGDRCALRLDLNGDDWDDLFTCRSRGTPLVFRNQRGTFVDVSSEHQLAYVVTDAAVGDLDGDRDADLVTASARYFSYHLFDAGVFGPRVRFGEIPMGGTGYRVSLGDLDGDDDLDVFGMIDDFPRSNPADFLWFNEGLVFTGLRLPPAGGFADNVAVVHPWRSDRDGFLVMNGYDVAGPIALLRVPPG